MLHVKTASFVTPAPINWFGTHIMGGTVRRTTCQSVNKTHTKEAKEESLSQNETMA